MVKNFVAFGILSLVVGCGSEMSSGTRKAGYVDPSQNCGANCPVVTTPIVGANADMPASYTFLDTPYANLCVDAFLRKGITIPDNAVARTLSARSIRSEGIGIADLEPSTIPVVNVVLLDSQCSNMMFQFYNPLGLYCIVKNTASFSNVRIQRSCSAQMTEIEPITHDSVNSKLGLFGWFKPIFRDPRATQGAYNSTITELPCVP
jgi:hypothetical protein